MASDFCNSNGEEAYTISQSVSYAQNVDKKHVFFFEPFPKYIRKNK